MNYIDYVIIGVVLVGFILGYKDGLVRKIIGLLGLIIAIILSVNYAGDLGLKLAPMFNNEPYLAKIISGIIIFLATILAFAILKRLLHPSDKVNKLINQLLGGAAGVLQVVFFLSVFLLFLNILNFPGEKEKEKSILYSTVYSVLPTTIDLLVGTDFKTEGFIKDYIKSKDNAELPEELFPIPDSLNQNDE